MRTQYSVWVKGSVLTELGWKEGMILDVLEGFQTYRQAQLAGAKALREMKTDINGNPVSPSNFKIGPAY